MSRELLHQAADEAIDRLGLDGEEAAALAGEVAAKLGEWVRLYHLRCQHNAAAASPQTMEAQRQRARLRTGG